jgi:CBS domain-containing protein
MKVSDIMTRDVVSVRSDATILDAGRLMLQSHIGGLPVVSSAGRLVGIITERDFLRLAATESSGRPRWLELITNHMKVDVDVLGRLGDEHVERVMTPNPVTISEEAPLEDVLRDMEKHSINRLPVVRGTRLVGIVSRSDLLRALTRSLCKASQLTCEHALEQQRIATLERDYWLRHPR